MARLEGRDVSGPAEIDMGVEGRSAGNTTAWGVSLMAATVSTVAEVRVGDGDDLSVGGVEDSVVGDDERGGRARGAGLAGVADEVDDTRAVWRGDMVGRDEGADEDVLAGEEDVWGAASATSDPNIPCVGATLPTSREGGP